MQRATVLGLHGMSADAWKRYSGEGFRLYDIVAAGYKYNMFELQAALGLVQLAKLDANWERRRARVAQYDALIARAFPGGEVTPLSYPARHKAGVPFVCSAGECRWRKRHCLRFNGGKH